MLHLFYFEMNPLQSVENATGTNLIKSQIVFSFIRADVMFLLVFSGVIVYMMRISSMTLPPTTILIFFITQHSQNDRDKVVNLFF